MKYMCEIFKNWSSAKQNQCKNRKCVIWENISEN